jgi:small nuclear ribonucleoprotein (snRNP)-like protein
MIVESKALSDQPITPEPRTTIEPRRPKPARPSRAVPFFLFCLLMVSIAALALYWENRSTATTFPTPYQAVLLSNGAVYYGKLQGFGTPHPVLTNVFYIVTSTDPNTKQTSNVLVKRGKELHAPDRMYLNPNSIVFVETVGAGSKVAQLISETSQ